MGVLAAVFAPLLMFGLAWVCGTPALHSRRLLSSATERAAYRFLFGFGLLGTVLFIVGLASFTPTLTRLLLFAGAIPPALSRDCRADFASICRPFRRSWSGLITAGLLAALYVAGLAEPVGDMGHDGIAYHLLGPKVWLREKRILPVLDHFHTTFPAVFEVLFGVLLGSVGPRSVGAFGAALFFLLLVQVYGFAYWLRGPRTARLAMITVATMPLIVTDGGVIRAFVDVPFAAFSLAGLRLATSSLQRRDGLVVGAFLGFAAGTKYTGIFVIGVTLITLLRSQLRSKSFPESLSVVALAALTSAMIAAPWYLRNLLELGTPIYPPPIFRSVFSPKGMPPESVSAFVEYIGERGKGLGRSPWDFLCLPFNLTFFPANFHGAGGIGLVPLGLAPTAILANRRAFKFGPILVWALLLTTTWFFTQQEARFLIHVIVVSAIVGAAGAAKTLRSESKAVKLLGLATLYVSWLYGSATVLYQLRDPLRAVVSPQFAESYRRQMVPHLKAIEFLNSAPDTGAVLVIDDAFPTYYLDRPYLKPLGVHGVFPYDDIRTPRDVVRSARRLGAKYLLMTPRSSTELMTHEDVAAEVDRFRIVFSSADAKVYLVE